MSELIRVLAAFSEAPGPGHARMAAALGLGRPPTRAEHTHLFVFQLHPYASVHLGPEGMLGGEGRDRVAGFWRALGLVPPAEPDHLATLLGLYATLREGSTDAVSEEARAVGGRARAALLREHLASWLFPWLEKATEVGPGPYGGWAAILQEVLSEELREVGGSGNGTLALHLREAPPLSDPREGEGDFLAEVLAPVRSGMIVTREDLAGAGRACGLGVRIGERRYTLEGFFGQAPRATLEWLAGEARGWARRHRAREEELGPTGAFWRGRAERAARLLEALAEDVASGMERDVAHSAPRTAMTPEETHA